MLIPTLREAPAEADVSVSHQLLLRSGMVRKVAAGVYILLPLGSRVVKKIENIIREEMDSAGGVELQLPIIQPAELWRRSGRWDLYGPEMFRLQDRHGREFCLGPTHEELITCLFAQEVNSYRQLPLLLYQIHDKYRDERRPRFGLLRGREFIMKDLYSFDKDEDGLEISYRKMYDAYNRIFSRCGLNFRAVEADSGAIGGDVSHEFMVIADQGEDQLLYCSKCNYAANAEKTPCPSDELRKAADEERPLQLAATPEARTVQDVAAYLQLSTDQVLKSLFFNIDGKLVVVLVRGDRSVNETKVLSYLGADKLEIADSEELRNNFGIPMGFAGPVGLQEKTSVTILGDTEVKYLYNAVAGANKSGYHYLNVNPGRDYQVDHYDDFRVAQEGDPCPCCGGSLQMQRGIEVGHIFKLGTRYSEAMGASFLNEKGKEIPVIMGCYGIGVTRTMAAAVEQSHDQDGIIWPSAISPFHAVIMAVDQRNQQQAGMASEIYQQLTAAGIETLYDDREERPGVKFKDADLIGCPVRVVVGKKAITDGLVEIKRRSGGEMAFRTKEKITGYLQDILADMLHKQGTKN
jgi:prolyl-tRNA synthetase